MKIKLYSANLHESWKKFLSHYVGNGEMMTLGLAWTAGLGATVQASQLCRLYNNYTRSLLHGK